MTLVMSSAIAHHLVQCTPSDDAPAMRILNNNTNHTNYLERVKEWLIILTVTDLYTYSYNTGIYLGSVRALIVVKLNVEQVH